MENEEERQPSELGPAVATRTWRVTERARYARAIDDKINAESEGPDPRDWLAAIIDGSDDAIVSKDLRGIIQSWNPGAHRLFGYEAEEVIGKPVTILIPEDRLDEEPAILREIHRGMRVEHFETVRRRKDGSMVDISLTISPIRNGEGLIVGASKIARNIAEKRLAQQQQQLLMGEMRHRIKNLFALANAIVSISGRSAGSMDELLATIQARLTSLARAHDLTMSDWQCEMDAALTISLRTLFLTILEPYGAQDRVVFAGADLVVGSKPMTHVALLFHELATNAAKYGCLSAADGHLDLTVDETDDRIRLVWQEIGGPEPSPGSMSGFGSRLEKGLASALGAKIERDWRPTGLVASILIPRATLDG